MIALNSIKYSVNVSYIDFYKKKLIHRIIKILPTLVPKAMIKCLGTLPKQKLHFSRDFAIFLCSVKRLKTCFFLQIKILTN